VTHQTAKRRAIAVAWLAFAVALLAGGAMAEARPSSKQGAGGKRTAEEASNEPAPLPGKQTIRMDRTIRFHRLGLTDGLPQSHVTAIVQDRIGFMWFGTQEGLARYDGSAFTVYRHNVGGPGPLPSSSITALAADETGRLWIGTEAGLVTYDTTTDTFAAMPPRAGPAAPDEGTDGPAPGPVQVVSALLATDDAVWVGYSDGTLDRVDPATRAVTSSVRPAGASANAAISALAQDRQRSIWVGTQGAGLFQLDGAGRVVRQPGSASTDGPGADNINALTVARSGTLWVGTEEAGLAALGQGGRFERITAGEGTGQLTDARVTFVVEDAGGALWVGTKNGLNRLDPSTRLVDQIFATQTLDPGALSFGWLTSGALGRDGVVWIGTFANGLSSFDRLATQFHFIDPNLLASSFCEDDDEVLWIGTYPGSLIRFDRKRRKADIYTRFVTDDGTEIDLSPAWITRIHVTPDKKVWMLIIGIGLVSFDPSTQRARVHTDEDSQLGANAGWGLAADPSGTLWLATWGGGLVKFDPRSQKGIVYSAADGLSGLPTDNLYAVTLDRRDPSVLWLGTAKHGLVRFDSKTETSKVFRHAPDRPDSLSHDDVLSIWQGIDGNLWIGTYGGGLNHFDERSGRFERFHQNVGLTAGTIYGVVGDERGVIWMSTNGAGLVRFDPSTRRVLAFDSRDGVPNEYGQGLPYRGPSGRLYYGGPPGFAYWFRPEQIELDTAAPRVVLTGMQVNNRPPALDKPTWQRPALDLRHNETLLSFRLRGLAYASPLKTRYQYRIGGVTDGWVDAAGSQVTLNLPSDGGDYALQVRSASRHGIWGPPATLATVAVAPPPWNTWWAYTLYGLGVALVVAAVAWAHNRRLARLRQANRLALVERDLELTGAVQAGFLPKDDLIVNRALEVRGFYRPAGTCSGDWWWYEETDRGLHRLLIGDVTGHGPGPAMVTAAVASSYRAQSELATDLPLKRRLEAVNQEVLRVGQGTYQMALTAIEIDVEAGQLFAYSAGGLPAIVLSDGPAEVVVCRGTPLGTAKLQIGQTSRALRPGSRIFLSTDGVVEIELHNGRAFGLRRLIRLLENTREVDVNQTALALSQEASAANGTNIQKDDWTFAIVDWDRREAGRTASGLAFAATTAAPAAPR
jgi:ligand-binding sensor domain-containing protein/serine phosphatase RsbU (regulator of sigma subunit)